MIEIGRENARKRRVSMYTWSPTQKCLWIHFLLIAMANHRSKKFEIAKAKYKHTQLDVSVESKQDIVRLDISVNNALGMKVLKSKQSLEAIEKRTKESKMDEYDLESS